MFIWLSGITYLGIKLQKSLLTSAALLPPYLEKGSSTSYIRLTDGNNGEHLDADNPTLERIIISCLVRLWLKAKDLFHYTLNVNHEASLIYYLAVFKGIIV